MNPFRLALRRLSAAPGFTGAVVATLALGVGANTLVFSAINGLLIRPLPFVEPHSLAWVFARTPEATTLATLSDDEANALAQGMDSLEYVAVIGDKGLVRELGDRHARWRGLWVTLDLFKILNVVPAAGRALGREDLAASTTPAMMISYERWRQGFSGDPSLVGRDLQFADNKRFRIVGILPMALEFPFARSPHSGNGTGFAIGTQDFWVLGHGDAGSLPGGVTIARIGRGATPRSAQAEADALSTRLAQDLPEANRRRTLSILPMRDQVLGALAPALPLLQGFAALVFLIACVNVANLILVRSASQAAETAVRVALGARAMDLAKVLLAEGVVLSAAGSGAGLAIAWTGRALLARLNPAPSAILERIEVNGTVLLFALGVFAVVAIAIGLLPVRATSGVPLNATLGRAGQRQIFGAGRPLLRTLVISQVALSVVLLLGAGVLRQSLHRLLSVDAGYQPQQVVTADVLLFIRKPAPFFQHVYDRLRSLPEVEAVGLVQSTPLTGKWTVRDPMRLLGEGPATTTPPIPGSMVAFDYFEAMGIPVLAGRTFVEREFMAPNPPAIIINDVAARLFFPGRNPVGAHVELFGAPREIVGVVQGTRDVRLEAAPEPQWYQPMFFGGSQIVVRTSVDPSHFVETLRRELVAADPRVIITSIEPLDAIVAASVLERRMTSHLVTAFAGLALALAAIGLYGVMQFIVTRQTREFGVRTALGARRGQIVAMVLRQGVALTGVGVAVALLISLPLGRSLQRLLFEVQAVDPPTMAAVSLLVLFVSAAACAPPAWRAATVDPAVTLRSD